MQPPPPNVPPPSSPFEGHTAGTVRALPKHLGIVLHGQRRWLEEHAFPADSGLTRATGELIGIVDRCLSLQVEQLTLYVFSDDIGGACTAAQGPDATGFLRQVRRRLAGLLHRAVRLRVQGDAGALAPPLGRVCLAAQERSAHHVGMRLTLSIDGCQAPGRTQEMPAGQPDLVIRIGGHLPMAHSLLWDTAETALYCDPAPWPAFRLQAFDAALSWFLNPRRSQASWVAGSAERLAPPGDAPWAPAAPKRKEIAQRDQPRWIPPKSGPGMVHSLAVHGR